LNLEFIDIDYPDLVDNKYNMMLQAPEILNVINYDKSKETDFELSKLGLRMSTPSYKLIGCDLKDQEKYKAQLSALLSQNSIKIFVAEVSLAYMEPQHANPIIEISSSFNLSHFLILEQNLPGGRYNSFAQKMIYHFDHLRHPLKCVESYPLVKDQVSRFKLWYPYVEIANLFENWQCLVMEETKRKVAEIEEFDEWEEFILFCQHYNICHATNAPGDQMIYPSKSLDIDEEILSDESLSIKVDKKLSSQNFQLKYPAVTSIGNNIVIQGGLGQTRTDDMIIWNGNAAEVSQGPIKVMAHTLTTMNDGTLVLIGGRTRPGQEFKQVYHYKDNTWNMICELPYGVSRHSCVVVNDDEILVFSQRKFTIVNVKERVCYNVDVTGDEISGLTSVGMDFDIKQGVGYISGGMVETINPVVNGKLYRFAYDNKKVSIDTVDFHKQFCRIGCRLHIVGEKVLIIGGISPWKIFTTDNIIAYNPNTKDMSVISVDSETEKEFPPMLIGFGSCKTDDGIKIVAGGAVCYSFGNVCNHCYTIS
jgi:tRNA wybutosine-synthesizing protein 4